MLPRFGKLCPSVRQAFRSSGSIVRASDRPSAAQEASSECPTGLPRPRKHRPSVRQAFRSSGSIVRASDRPSAAQEASSDYSRLMTSAGFSCAARGTPDTSSGTKSDKQSQDYHNQTIKPAIYRGLFNILLQPTSHHQRPYRKGDEAGEK